MFTRRKAASALKQLKAESDQHQVFPEIDMVFHMMEDLLSTGSTEVRDRVIKYGASLFKVYEESTGAAFFNRKLANFPLLDEAVRVAYIGKKLLTDAASTRSDIIAAVSAINALKKLYDKVEGHDWASDTKFVLKSGTIGKTHAYLGRIKDNVVSMAGDLPWDDLKERTQSAIAKMHYNSDALKRASNAAVITASERGQRMLSDIKSEAKDWGRRSVAPIPHMDAADRAMNGMGGKSRQKNRKRRNIKSRRRLS